MKNEIIIFPYIEQFYNNIIAQNYVIVNNVKTVELLNVQFKLNPQQPILDFKVKKTNLQYCEKELKWYLSCDRKIDMVEDVTIWRQVAAKDKTINSNYGWCVFSSENYNQFNNVIQKLKENQTTRQAIMIYTRPSMHYEWNENGRSDFICTNYHHFFIRNNQLISIYNMRSEDFIFGFFNDWYWGAYMHNLTHTELLQTYPNLQNGYVIWSVNSLHVYERHFDLIKKIYENFNKQQ